MSNHRGTRALTVLTCDDKATRRSSGGGDVKDIGDAEPADNGGGDVLEVLRDVSSQAGTRRDLLRGSTTL
ncbi:hypothetical protein CYMTET_48424 [Cymbomonas tetramitiformis]|uniref:Uncharacterized protein n=1 Tax=Cymbomonas tetramitiformis TaxID=36881 RepID=A0AAE0EVL4_9CHLO|nr:hypothetical protein CYMTET_48424 [Cymbomonas tetramitiformis]